MSMSSSEFGGDCGLVEAGGSGALGVIERESDGIGGVVGDVERLVGAVGGAQRVGIGNGERGFVAAAGCGSGEGDECAGGQNGGGDER